MIICLSEEEARKLGLFERIKEMKPPNPYFHFDDCTLIELDYSQSLELGLINPILPKLGGY